MISAQDMEGKELCTKERGAGLLHETATPELIYTL